VTLRLSPQIKLVALVGILAALGLGLGSMLLAQSQKFSSSPVTTVPLKHAHVTPRPAATPAHRTVKAHAPRTTAKAPATHGVVTPILAKPVVAKPVVHKPTAQRAPVAPAPRTTAPAATIPPVSADGLPLKLARLLRKHDVVVVALYDPEVEADAIALAEARAGARDAHAGFLAVDVLDGRLTGPLTAAAGQGTVLPDPGILIYKNPGMLMNRIDGFSDRGAVAQAVASALLANAPAGS
jgi:hypothetical protein